MTTEDLNPDDWKDQYFLQLQQSILYQELVAKCGDRDADVVAMVDVGVSYAFQRTKTIVRHLGEYTLHDGDHLFRVLNLMGRLLTEENVKNLSIPELALLILSAFFHDIGMAPNEREILLWKKFWDSAPVEFESNFEEKSFYDFKKFCLSRPADLDRISSLVEQGKNADGEVYKGYLISSYIRETHADRAKEILDKDKFLGEERNNRVVFRNEDLTVELAGICHSHNEDAAKLLTFDKDHLCAPGIYACLPLIGIVLRLADILDFDSKRTPAILFSHLYVRHPVSLQEWGKHRSIRAWEINQSIIQFNAKCEHPAIEAAIHEFCDIIDSELGLCNNILKVLNEFNKNSGRDIIVNFPFKANREKIETAKDIYGLRKYIYRDTKFSLSKRQVIDLLMGTQLYGNPQVALRELLQNSIDACLMRKSQEDNWNNPYTPEITIKYYNENGEDVLEIADNGTGMDQYIIDNYYTKVGSSFYRSIDFNLLKIESNSDLVPTSRFGIGILSSFMVADTLVVDTMKIYGPQKSSEAINMTVEGQESIFWIRPGKRTTVGTTTKLILRKKNPWERMSDKEFIDSAKAVVPNPPFKIHIQSNTESLTIDEDSFNDVMASELKDHTWQPNDNIKNFEFSFGGVSIKGKVIVAILDSQGMPVDKLEIRSKIVPIEGTNYPLSKELKIDDHYISQRSTSITIDESGTIKSSNSTQWLAESKSRVSLHGIEVTYSLFPRSWQVKPGSVKMLWPFSQLIVVDICGTRDQDLNSARTEIMVSEKWSNFEEELAYLICQELSKQVSDEYWAELRDNILQKSKNENFLRGLARVVKSDCDFSITVEKL